MCWFTFLLVRAPYNVLFEGCTGDKTMVMEKCNYGYYTQDVLFKIYTVLQAYTVLFVPFQVLCGLLGYLPLHGTVLIVIQSAHDVYKMLAVEAIENF